MALRKYVPTGEVHSISMKTLRLSGKEVHKNAKLEDPGTSHSIEHDVGIDLREVYFLIMHFLSAGPCHRTFGQLWNELLEHQLLPRRYHAWYSRSGAYSGDENDDGLSFPLSYNKLVERYPHIEKDHLVKLLEQLILNTATPRCLSGGNALNAADVPTLLGTGAFSLISDDKNKGKTVNHPPAYMCWPHMKADQVRGLSLREIGGFRRHHRAPSTRATCYAIAKPSTMVQKMQNIKRLRGHRNAVYCAIFDRLGRYVVTGSDDRLVKIWSMETAFCLASCRGHEGDITDLAVSSNNALVASSSNDCIIRVWRLPDGLPISVLRGHTGAVTAIAFSPRPNFTYHLLSSSDDGTCRIWDARYSQSYVRVYAPRPSDSVAGKNSGPSSSTGPQNHQIFCCAFNANGTVFVTGSSDTLARVWNACKFNTGDSNQPNHEIDVLSGHENDVNYVQFSGCAAVSRLSMTDTLKEDSIPKFKNSWFSHDNIVTCSRDGSAIIWIPRSRRSHGKVGRWTRAYHLKVPPPTMPPQPPRGGPRQRILPTPRGVNMIVWSLDNRFVLAAIMDCRICVWNAGDGSLVHSLTGHTESTYVLDVHPFNPRIAMSAGYDGKTIVWDIWAGKPIRIFEISHFKLVDGKFSPDGISIILSDDVGQLYILSTGQGESQEDAKYDQFFLGDYRPLIQDTNGNMVDRETQLPPYKRNMEDSLCDSGMIPYEEPYQSMYQKRRLGALGMEYRPTSLRVAIGPDITLDQEYQIQPLADLDMLLDPIPEFLDVMDWEPENEVQSDDDSEYNVPEEYSTAGEQGSVSSSLSGNPQCSTDNSDAEENCKDGLRRSRRKKQKAEFDVVTSSGRRVKRRDLDECDGTSSRKNQTRKLRNGQKASRKSSKSKSGRPRRAAARNALSLFSKITGRSTDGEDEESSDDNDLSESESTLQGSNIESTESDRYLPNNQNKLSKGKEVSFAEFEDVSEPHEIPSPHINAGNRKRLILKFPIRDSDKRVLPVKKISKSDSQVELAGTSSKVPEDISDVDWSQMSQDPEFSGATANWSGIEGGEKGQLDKIEGNLVQSEGHRPGKIRWGGVKARTAKRLKLGGMTPSEACAGTSTCLGDFDLSKRSLNGYIKPEDVAISPELKIEDFGGVIDGVVCVNGQQHRADDSEFLNATNKHKVPSGFNTCEDDNEFPRSAYMDSDATNSANVSYDKGRDQSPELKEKLTPTKFKIRSKRVAQNPESSSNLKTDILDENCGTDRHLVIPGNHLEMEQNPVTEAAYDGTNITNSDNEPHQLQELAVRVNKDTTLHGTQDLPSHSNKVYTAAYRRSKSRRKNSGVDIGMVDINLHMNDNDNNLNTGVNFKEGAADDGGRRTRSMGLKEITRDPSTLSNSSSRQELESEDTCKSPQNGSMAMGKHHQHEEWGSSTRISLGLRPTRNRKGSSYIHDTSPIDKRKSHQSGKRASWLMLSTHEEGSRYIPQQGDHVVYLRQGHQEYLNYSRAREAGPWTSIEGNIRAVEFCRIEDLEYSTHPGSGDSCCKMILQFVDSISTVFGKSFKLTLPEVTGFPDFLVERTRFDVSVQRNWSCRDKCRVWWKNEGEEDGSWWDGRILAVKPKSSEYPDSPWERYTIQYKSDPTETHLHSPWELYDADTQWEQPCLDCESRKKLLSAVRKLMNSGNSKDHYGVQKLMQSSEKSNFMNRFPVPLSLKVIMSRLENNYYRRLEAVKHDVMIMLTNAESYFGKNVDNSQRIARLSDWFDKTLSSL